MIPDRHEHIPDVAADHHIARGLEVGKAVQRQMSLDEAAMELALETLGDRLKGSKRHIEPRRHYADRCRERAILEKQIRNDGLHPGGACLVGTWRSRCPRDDAYRRSIWCCRARCDRCIHAASLVARVHSILSSLAEHPGRPPSLAVIGRPPQSRGDNGEWNMSCRSGFRAKPTLFRQTAGWLCRVFLGGVFPFVRQHIWHHQHFGRELEGRGTVRRARRR